MSYDKDRFWLPPGLSAIQFQLNIALSRRAAGDEIGAYDSFKDLAVLTENIEIIELAEKFAAETERELAFMSSRGTVGYAEKFKFDLEKIKYMKTRNYHFLKLIVLKCGEKGITIKVPVQVEKGGEPSV